VQTSVSVQQRINQLAGGGSGGGGGVGGGGGDADPVKAAPRKRRPNSQAFELFESTGMIIKVRLNEYLVKWYSSVSDVPLVVRASGQFERVEEQRVREFEF
jgi:hypothetical protein